VWITTICIGIFICLRPFNGLLLSHPSNTVGIGVQSVAGCFGVMPPADASGQPVGLADSFEVPVLVRRSSPLQPERRPHKNRIDKAWVPWPAVGDVPPPDDYLVSTTWREVIDAAMTVGRDPFAWLAAVPRLASAEIIARRSPLAAYLHRVSFMNGLLGTTGYRLEPNVVYREGTEKTARAMFAYRIGMTMAEWACRRLMGLGPTIHAEAASRLPGRGPAWSQKNGQPDLVGFHWRSPDPWLVEAKAARRTGKTELSKGASQLSAIGLMTGPHVRVLCGTSIEDRVFMTVDVEVVAGEAESDPVANDRSQSPEVDDAELLALARSRMLNFYALQSLPRESLSVRPVGPAVVATQTSRGRATNLVVPLERDESTRTERLLARDEVAYARRPPSSKLDMLTGQIPGTDVVLGMSRRLFAACRSLAAEEAQLLLAVQTDLPDLPVTTSQGLIDEEEVEDRLRERRAVFAEREAGIRDRLGETTRQAYEIGRESSWQQLLDAQPQLVTDSPANLLESATPDTYLGIDANTTTAADE
jgi:hypothetical protein